MIEAIQDWLRSHNISTACCGGYSSNGIFNDCDIKYLSFLDPLPCFTVGLYVFEEDCRLQVSEKCADYVDKKTYVYDFRNPECLSDLLAAIRLYVPELELDGGDIEEEYRDLFNWDLLNKDIQA